VGVQENHGAGVERGSERVRERSGEQTKSAVQILLRGDASLLKLCKSILLAVKNK